MASFLSAIGFLTIFPIPARIRADVESLRYSWMWFPFVGLLVGALSGVVYAGGILLGMPEMWAASVAILMLVISTRALHYDGFADTVDAVFGGFSKEDRLRIMKDPHIGTFAVLGLVFLVFFQIQAVALLSTSQVISIMATAGVISRWGVLWPMFSVVYAKQQGLGLLFEKSSSRYAVTTLITLGVMLVLTGLSGVVLMLVAFIASYALGLFANYRFGGLTGDVCGFIIILLELLVISASSFVMSFSL